MTRKTYITKNGNCPRCKFGDKVEKLKADEHWLGKRIRDWFRNNTTYTEEQLKNASHYCDR